MLSTDNDLDSGQTSPAVNQPHLLEMMLEVFKYLPNKQVFTKLPLVSRKWNKAVQMYSVYVQNLVLVNPTENLLKSVGKKVKGCKSFKVRLAAKTGHEREMMAQEMRKMDMTYLELFTKLQSSVEEITALWFPADVLVPLINKAIHLRSLRIIHDFQDWEIDKLEVNHLVEVYKSVVGRCSNLKMLKAFPNLRHLECTFCSNLVFNGLKPEDTMNLKVFKTWGHVPSIFIHLEELEMHIRGQRRLKEFVRTQLPHLTKLKRLEISVFLRHGDSLYRMLNILGELFKNLPGFLTTVKSLNIVRRGIYYKARLSIL